jgi:hypothetical protein
MVFAGMHSENPLHDGTNLETCVRRPQNTFLANSSPTLHFHLCVELRPIDLANVAAFGQTVGKAWHIRPDLCRNVRNPPEGRISNRSRTW